MELKEQNEKMEGLVNFLEDEKNRLQDKVEKMMAAGEQQWKYLSSYIYALQCLYTHLMLYPRQRAGAGVGGHAY